MVVDEIRNDAKAKVEKELDMDEKRSVVGRACGFLCGGHEDQRTRRYQSEERSKRWVGE